MKDKKLQQRFNFPTPSHLEVDEDDVVEDGGVVGHVALEELDLGDGDEVLHQEALVQAPYPSPLTPGASLLTRNNKCWCAEHCLTCHVDLMEYLDWCNLCQRPVLTLGAN